jgi:hypothetical protein
MAASSQANAGVIDIDMNEPWLDRWFYPFNVTPGVKLEASVFGAVSDPEDGFVPEFDNRDGQMLIGFNTTAQVASGLGKTRYQVSSAKVYVTISSDLTFAYDPTPDPYTSWLPSTHPDFTPDPDTGRPLEIFGAAFRCDYTAPTYPETGPFCDGCSCFPPNPCVSVRCVYPIDYDGSGQPRDVSNNVTDEFDPIPFGVAITSSVQPGDGVPALTEIVFELDVTNPKVRQYLHQALNDGILDLVIASIYPAAQQQAGTFPKIFCKESGQASARLEVDGTLGQLGDLDGNGSVGIGDLFDLFGAWGPCPQPCPPLCLGDLDGDCIVGITDLFALFANWNS